MNGFILILMSIFLLHCESKQSGKVDLSNKNAKNSYGVGLDIGKRMKEQGVQIDIDSFMVGLTHGIKADPKPLLDEKALRETLNDFRKEMMESRQKQMEIDLKKNEEEGKAFLDQNKTKEGVKTLESGLQYLVLKEGDGPIPKLTDQVKTHYRGTLLNGTEFDSSYERGEPATFPLQGVIKGWTEALQLMKTGSKWKLFIPASLAYGPQGSPPKIGPNSTLIFEVELLEIVASAEPEKKEKLGKK